MRSVLRALCLGAMVLGCTVVVARSSAETPDPPDATTLEAVRQKGQEVFTTNCMGCHGPTGGGGVGVPLAGNDFLEDTEYVIEQIVYGGGFMPGFGHLSDEEIAAVATYVRTSWGNDFGLVTVEEVAAHR